jgi:hypothetical protein
VLRFRLMVKRGSPVTGLKHQKEKRSALGPGLRWTIDQMGQEAATRVKQDNVGWLTENKIDRVETNAIYAIGTKRP